MLDASTTAEPQTADRPGTRSRRSPTLTRSHARAPSPCYPPLYAPLCVPLPRKAHVLSTPPRPHRSIAPPRRRHPARARPCPSGLAIHTEAAAKETSLSPPSRVTAQSHRPAASSPPSLPSAASVPPTSACRTSPYASSPSAAIPSPTTRPAPTVAALSA